MISSLLSSKNPTLQEWSIEKVHKLWQEIRHDRKNSTIILIYMQCIRRPILIWKSLSSFLFIPEKQSFCFWSSLFEDLLWVAGQGGLGIYMGVLRLIAFDSVILGSLDLALYSRFLMLKGGERSKWWLWSAIWFGFGVSLSWGKHISVVQAVEMQERIVKCRTIKTTTIWLQRHSLAKAFTS